MVAAIGDHGLLWLLLVILAVCGIIYFVRRM